MTDHTLINLNNAPNNMNINEPRWFQNPAATYGNDMGGEQHDKHKWVLWLDKSDELLILNGEWLTDAIIITGTIHWVTLSTIGCAEGFIDIYDSHHPQLNLTWQQQIAFILFCQEKEITVN